MSLTRAASSGELEGSADGSSGEIGVREAAAFVGRWLRGLVRAVGATAVGGGLVRTAAAPAVDGGFRTLGFRARTGAAPVIGVSLTICQSLTETSFRRPARSGRRSISE